MLGFKSSGASATLPSGQETPPSGPRFKRLAKKPLKPLKLAASAIGSVPSRLGGTLHSSTSSTQDDVDSSAPPTPDLYSTAMAVPLGSSTTSASTSTDGYLEPPAEPKKRSKFPGRRKHQKTGGAMILDAAQVAQAAQGPRKPLENEEPAAILRVRVVSADGLVAKDRNGSSDPCVLKPPPGRH